MEMILVFDSISWSDAPCYPAIAVGEVHRQAPWLRPLAISLPGSHAILWASARRRNSRWDHLVLKRFEIAVHALPAQSVVPQRSKESDPSHFQVQREWRPRLISSWASISSTELCIRRASG